MKKLLRWCAQNLQLIVLFCATLGLAPFTPQPHVWEKLKWVAAGASGMAWFDWLDLLLHGSPWVLLVLGLLGKLLPFKTREKPV
ncbi:MAG: hypothetical protein U5L96_01400 [Owenweeksia sp.]|nr:hypothetical protein [Owenweeksia sp.]